MCHIPPPNLHLHILAILEGNTTTLFTSPSDCSNEVRGREATRLAVQGTVQDQDLEARTAGTSDAGAHTLQYEGWDDGGVEAADAVDQGFCSIDGFKHFGVGRWPHFLAVRVDVPESLDSCGKRLLGIFGEVDVGLAERWQGAREVRVFDRGVVEIG